MVVITAWAGFYLGSMHSGISSMQIGLHRNPRRHRPRLRRSRRAERSPRAQVRRQHAPHRRPPAPLGTHRPAHGILLGLLAIAVGASWLTLRPNLLTGSARPAHRLHLRRHLHPAQALHARSPPSSAPFPAPWVRCSAGPPPAAASSGRPSPSSPSSSSGSSRTSWPSPGSIAKTTAAPASACLPVVQPDGWSTVVEALVYAVLMIPGQPAARLSAYGRQLLRRRRIAARDCLSRLHRPLRADPQRPDVVASRSYARELLKVSVLYLPLLLIAMMLNATAKD